MTGELPFARRIKRVLFRGLLALLPLSLRVALTRRFFPQLRRYLPHGREIMMDDYLGRFRVALDMAYPIEREMLVNWYEPDAVAVIDSLVLAGDTCIDIGANVGALTLALARRVGPSGKIFAFEPGPLTYPRLLRNIRLNPAIARCVVAERLGLSDTPGELLWSEEVGNPGNATLLGSSGVPVQVVTVDDYFGRLQLERIRLVKIDVEGMELEVLRGGRETWIRHRPFLYFETLRAFETARGMPLFGQIQAVLGEIGYALFRIDSERRLRAVTGDSAEMYTLAVPDSYPELVDGSRLPGASARPRRPARALSAPR